MGATIAGTKAYFEFENETQTTRGSPLVLGRTGFTVSPVGFGCYRVGEGHEVQAMALETALLQGCNLIDTSTNYGNGSSERLVGHVLNKLCELKRLTREQIVVVSKIGYVQGDNLAIAREREAAGAPFDQMVHYHEDCWHCISPQFLEDQITRSLERLGLQTIDVLLLHNPEYFLKAGGSHADYYERIQQAFGYLESEVKRGRIQYYGISSNTFPDEKDSAEYTSLETVTSLAEALGAGRHFAVVQFPLNLYEPGAVLEENNTSRTVAAFAAEKNLGTLINRPLNAFKEGHLIRLADFPSHEGSDVMGDLKLALEKSLQIESKYPGKHLVPIHQVAWGHILKENMNKLAELDTWRQVLEYQIRPAVEATVSALSEYREYQGWISDYWQACDRLFKVYTSYLESFMAQGSRNIARALDGAAPALRSSPSLAQKVIRVYRSFPGIQCILVGMRQPSYVTDVLALEPPLAAPEAFAALQAAHTRVGGAIEH